MPTPNLDTLLSFGGDNFVRVELAASFSSNKSHWNIDWFDVLDDENRPVLTEREVIRNLQAIVIDADKTHRSEVRPLSAFSHLTYASRSHAVR
jgi:hypothetical protein